MHTRGRKREEVCRGERMGECEIEKGRYFYCTLKEEREKEENKRKKEYENRFYKSVRERERD